MVQLFPLEVKPAYLKEVLSLLRENGGSAQLSQIAKDSRAGLDQLFPVIEAAKMLDLITIKNGVVSLTALTKTNNQKELRKVINNIMPKLEPFKSMLDYLKKRREASTEDLFDLLLKNGMTTQINRGEDIADFRRELLALLARTEICGYKADKDSWIAL